MQALSFFTGLLAGPAAAAINHASFVLLVNWSSQRIDRGADKQQSLRLALWL
jgi:hypothetical protein